MLRGLKHTFCAPGPGDPTRTEPELCLSVFCGSTGQQWTAVGAGALDAEDLEEVTIYPTIEPPELTQDWKQTLGGHKQKLVCTRTQEKGAETLQETDPDLPVNVQKSLGRRWPAAWLGALSVVVHAWDLWKEVAIIHITSTIVWLQVKQQGGNTTPPINRKLN